MKTIEELKGVPPLTAAEAFATASAISIEELALPVLDMIKNAASEGFKRISYGSYRVPSQEWPAVAEYLRTLGYKVFDDNDRGLPAIIISWEL